MFIDWGLTFRDLSDEMTYVPGLAQTNRLRSWRAALRSPFIGMIRPDLPFLEWLLVTIDDQPMGEPPPFELLESHGVNVERLRDIQMVVHSVRALLLVAELELVSHKFRLIGDGLTESIDGEDPDGRASRVREWCNELNQLVDAYPYLQAVDEAAEGPFREKLQLCGEKLRLKAKTAGNSPQFLRERDLFRYIERTLAVYPLGCVIKTLKLKSDSSS